MKLVYFPKIEDMLMECLQSYQKASGQIEDGKEYRSISTDFNLFHSLGIYKSYFQEVAKLVSDIKLSLMYNLVLLGLGQCS